MKSPDAFRTISEAATELGVPQHVLRFWETKFSFIRPMKRAGGRRFYRRQDIDVLRGVRSLLHDDGYTIKGVQRLHKEHGVSWLVEAASHPESHMRAPFEAGSASTETSYTAPMEAAAGEAQGKGLLSPHARSRLAEVLGDIELIKARLDHLLIGENS